MSSFEQNLWYVDLQKLFLENLFPYFSTSESVYLSNSKTGIWGGCLCEARSEEWSYNSYELQDLLAI